MENPILDEGQTKAVEEAKKYIQSLELDFEATYGNPFLIDVRSEEEQFKSSIPLTHYKINAYLTDDDAELEMELLFDSEKSGLVDPLPTRENVIAAMEGQRQHYVLIVTKNPESARRIGEAVYDDKGVASVDVGPLKQMNLGFGDTCIFGRKYLEEIHVECDYPELFRMKPEEEKRRDVLKGSPLEKSG